MAYSKTQIGGFLAGAAVIAVVAVVGFGVPLGTLLIIGLVLCCPLMMLGARRRACSRRRVARDRSVRGQTG
jgi:hypothetical protein